MIMEIIFLKLNRKFPLPWSHSDFCSWDVRSEFEFVVELGIEQRRHLIAKQKVLKKQSSKNFFDFGIDF